MKRKDLISFFCIVSYMFVVFGGLQLYLSNEHENDVKNAMIFEHLATTRKNVCKNTAYVITSYTRDNIDICIRRSI